MNKYDVDLSGMKKLTGNDSLKAKLQKQLSEYFSGSRKSFSMKLDLQGTEFQKRVWNELTKIPYGKTITYKELAVRLGNVKSIRAAGTANGANPIPIIIPCHRVIGSDGSLTGYAGGLEMKEKLLQLEGSREPNLFPAL